MLAIIETGVRDDPSPPQLCSIRTNSDNPIFMYLTQCSLCLLKFDQIKIKSVLMAESYGTHNVWGIRANLCFKQDCHHCCQFLLSISLSGCYAGRPLRGGHKSLYLCILWVLISRDPDSRFQMPVSHGTGCIIISIKKLFYAIYNTFWSLSIAVHLTSIEIRESSTSIPFTSIPFNGTNSGTKMSLTKSHKNLS